MEIQRRLETSKSAILNSSLQHELTMEKKEHAKIVQELNGFKGMVASSTQRYDELSFRIERSKEEIFIFLGSGVGSKPHTKSITSLDWSTDGLTVQSASLDAGELNFWQPSIFWQSLDCNGPECWQVEQAATQEQV